MTLIVKMKRIDREKDGPGLLVLDGSDAIL
jgi:hypothetical protein